jgi:Lon protease-like protein
MERIESLPLFPLADIALLPGVSIPLRLFEPRYVEMIRHAIEGTHQIGMVTVRPEGLADMAGDPPIFEIGCLGQITQSQEQPDGTIHILLLGQRRFRILQEDVGHEGRLFRLAQVELLKEVFPSEADEQVRLEQWRTELFVLLTKFVQRLDPAETEEHVIDAFSRLDPAHLMNALSQSIALDPIERQQLLEADGVASRFQIMCELLRFRLAEIASGNQNSMSLPN